MGTNLADGRRVVWLLGAVVWARLVGLKGRAPRVAHKEDIRRGLDHVQADIESTVGQIVKVVRLRLGHAYEEHLATRLVDELIAILKRERFSGALDRLLRNRRPLVAEKRRHATASQTMTRNDPY